LAVPAPAVMGECLIEPVWKRDCDYPSHDTEMFLRGVNKTRAGPASRTTTRKKPGPGEPKTAKIETDSSRNLAPIENSALVMKRKPEAINQSDLVLQPAAATIAQAVSRPSKQTPWLPQPTVMEVPVMDFPSWKWVRRPSKHQRLESVGNVAPRLPTMKARLFQLQKPPVNQLETSPAPLQRAAASKQRKATYGKREQPPIREPARARRR